MMVAGSLLSYERRDALWSIIGVDCYCHIVTIVIVLLFIVTYCWHPLRHHPVAR